MIPIRDTVHSRSLPVINWLLIILNVLAFMVMLSLGRGSEILVNAFGVVPARFIHQHNLYNVITIFTSMFLHGGWAHLISNMLALYIFGDNVEDRMGSFRYLQFYLLCGLIAAFVHIGFNPDSSMPTIGASGAISGVLAAYVLFFPTARVITLVPLFFLPWLIEIPAMIYLGMWFFSQLLNGVFTVVTGAQAFGGVAWWAHVGGFVGGILAAPLFVSRRNVRREFLDEYYPW